MSGNFSNCGQKNSAWLWKLHATCADKRSDQKNYFTRVFHFGSKFGGRVKTFRTFGVRFFRQIFRNCLLRVHGNDQTVHTILRQKLIDPYCFLSAVKKCLVFRQKFFSNLVKTSFHVSEETLREMMFWTETFLRIIFEVWVEFFLMFVKILFFKVRGIFPKRIFFFVFELSYQYCRNLNKNLRTFPKTALPVCQISIIHLKPFSWRKNILRNCKNVCFSYFKQKGRTDLGRNVFEISLYNDIGKIWQSLFQ